MGGRRGSHARCPRGRTGAAATGLIFAVNTPVALATKRTGTTLPVVFAQVSEPVATGLVDSLARPGRNFTGLTTINRELMSKRLELLKETIPGLARVGYLANPGYAVHKAQLAEMGAAARGLGLTLHLAEVRSPPSSRGRLHAWRLLKSAPSSCSRTICLSSTGPCSSISPPSVDCPGCLSSACIHGQAGSCPTEPTPRICTDERPTTWIESSRAPSHPICQWNGLPSSSGHQPQDRQGPRTDDPAVAAAACGSGHRLRDSRRLQDRSCAKASNFTLQRTGGSRCSPTGR